MGWEIWDKDREIMGRIVDDSGRPRRFDGLLRAYDELRWRKVLTGASGVSRRQSTAVAAGLDGMGIDHLIHCMIPLEFPL